MEWSIEGKDAAIEGGGRIRGEKAAAFGGGSVGYASFLIAASILSQPFSISAREVA